MNQSTFVKLCFLILTQLLLIRLSAESGKIKQFQEELKNTSNAKEQANILYMMARELSHSDHQLSLTYTKRGLQIAEENNDLENVAKFQRQLGRLYLEEGKKEEALEKLETAIQIAQDLNSKQLEAENRINLGYYWYRLGDSAQTISNYQKAFELYSDLNDYDGIAQSHLKLGWGYDVYGNYEKAEESFLAAADMQDKITDSTLMINVLTGMGAFYTNKSIKQHQAIQYFEEALRLAKLQGKKYHIGRTYSALGLLFSNFDKRDISQSYYLQALEIFEELGNKAEICWLYMQIGELFMNANEFDEALSYYEKALSIADQVDRSELQMAEVNMALGLLYSKKDNNHQRALEFFQASLSLAQKTANSYLVMKNELAIGVCLLAMGKPEEGKKWCKTAHEKAEDHLMVSQEACECLYKTEQELGNFEAALGYIEELRVLTDSLHNEEVSEKISNLAAQQAHEMKLAEVQKEQEIESANLRTRSTTIIAVISLCAILIIMLLWLSYVKKNAQKEQLQALAIIRKEMIANVSHDLRTPLTVMTGYVETLLMRLENISKKEQEKYLNIILNSADRLSQLVGQLFEYSKLEAKQIEPAKDVLHLSELITTALSRYEILAQKKKIEIQLNCAEEIPVVYADAILIERVIQNLMDNALKFTPENGTISICLSNHNQEVQVEIIDTGLGIPKEKEHRIFERYERSKSSDGAGLGLTIVKNILEMHGSSIQVNSQLNKGTRFTFSLPTA